MKTSSPHFISLRALWQNGFRCFFSAFLLPFFALFLVAAFSPARGQMTTNTELRAVPVPAGKTVVLDGKLDDWDRSGEIFSCYDAGELAGRFSVRTAAMYAAENLYLAFHFKDATPRVNRVDPAALPGFGWRSDSVQLRFWIDPEKAADTPPSDRVLHVDAYEYAPPSAPDGKPLRQPVARLLYHDIGARKGPPELIVPGSADVLQAFATDADGAGYVQEIRLPFSLLRRDGRPFRAGEALRLGLEFFWGDATGESWPAHRFADLVNAAHPQREFFWMSKESWGELRFMPAGNLPPSESAQSAGKAEEWRLQRYTTTGVVPFEYTLPADGFVTLVIENAQGERVRNWIADHPRKAGPNTELWDGCDDEGRLLPAGEYRVRGLRHEGLDALYQFSYGSPGNPPWDTADGTGAWLSDHAAPMAAASDGERVYLGAWTSEAGSTIVCCDLEGRRLWGVGRINAGPIALHGERLYVLSGGIHGWWDDAGKIRLTRIDTKAGKIVPFVVKDAADAKKTRKISELEIAQYDGNRPEIKPRDSLGQMLETKTLDAEWLISESLGLASDGTRLFVSMFYDDKILVVDPESGAVLESIALPRPTGLAVTAGGDLLALSGSSLFKISPVKPAGLAAETNAESASAPLFAAKPVALIDRKLTAPIGIALGRDGTVFVSEWGDSMSVRVFSADGKFLRRVGKAGGRSLRGAWEPGGMLMPRGLAVDGAGRLWVAEDDRSPKRVSVWDAAGKMPGLHREIIGPGWYGSSESSVDAANPRRAFWNGCVLELDWRRGDWRVLSTLWRPTKTAEYIGPNGEGLVYKTLERDGKRYLFTTGAGRMDTISLLENGGLQARPLMSVGSLAYLFTEAHTRLPELAVRKMFAAPEDEALARREFPALFTGYSTTPEGAHIHRVFTELFRRFERLGRPLPSHYLWTDGNADGAVQADEIRFFKPSEADGFACMIGWGGSIGPDFSIYSAGTVGKERCVFRLPLRGWSDKGIPQYDLADARTIYRMTSPHEIQRVWADARGGVVVNGSPLTMVTPEGRALWTFPNRWPGVHGSHTAPKDANGLLIGPLSVIGSTTVDAGKLENTKVSASDEMEIFCMNGNLGKAFLFTTDGLYVGSLLRDTRSAPDALPVSLQRGMSINNTTGGAEWFGGEFFRNAIDGKTYIGTAACTAQNLSEVVGLERIRRIEPRPLAFSEQAREQAAALAESRKTTAQEARQMAVVQLEIPLGGDLRAVPWNAARARSSYALPFQAHWRHDEKRSATATWTFDSEWLYLRVNVQKQGPPVNSGAVWSQLFKTGDCVALELRTQPGNAKPEPIPGDVRLLFTLFEGKPVAVLYDYLRPGAPLEFALGVAKVRIGDVRVLENAKVRIEPGGGSYTLAAAVPLAELKFAPKPGERYRGDVGVIYADAAGKVDELRMYWSNQATGLTSDLPMESKIDPARWGTFEIK